jgi:putative flippase GtrA
MPTIAKFMTVALIGLLVNAAIMAVTVDLYRLHYLVSQILATALVLVWNFAANHRWTFRW